MWLWQRARIRFRSMRLVPVAAAVLLTFSISASWGGAQNDRAVSGLFGAPSVLEAAIEAPFANLIANGRKDTDYAVMGTVRLADPATGRTTAVENVKITTRGHTSLRESECDFPK